VNTTDRKTKKAEEILKKMKKRDRKASKPYDGPPDPSFIALDAPKPESDRDVNDGAGRRD
jgi:hypothetical protein